jgi:hypothetical protein
MQKHLLTLRNNQSTGLAITAFKLLDLEDKWRSYAKTQQLITCCLNDKMYCHMKNPTLFNVPKVCSLKCMNVPLHKIRKPKQDGQCMYNVTMRHVCKTTVATEKQ